MQYRSFSAVLLLFALFPLLVTSQTGKLLLTVAYCPDAFSSGGAIVSVDPATGNFNIEAKFSWPREMTGDGCPALLSPTITLKHSSKNENNSPNTLALQILADESFLIQLDLDKGKILSSVLPSDYFFTGFENMAYDTALSNTLRGFSGTVTQSGYCSDGCFQYGTLTTDKGQYKSIANIPFKALMDDSHFLDLNSNIFWVQASYDLRTQICGPRDSSECLLAIDSNTGALKSATYTNYTIYKYENSLRSDGTLLAFVEGFDSLCRNPNGNFVFARVHLQSAKATPIACITNNTVIQEDEWIGSFSLDGSLFATGSGDAQTGSIQVLVFNTASGKVILDSKLPGLPEQLHSYLNMLFVWAVDFV